MVSKIFFMALGLALMAFSVLIWRPGLYGPGAPHVPLDGFEDYRPVVAGVAAYMGAVFFIAAAWRPWRIAPVVKKAPKYEFVFEEDAAAQPDVEAEPGPFMNMAAEGVAEPAPEAEMAQDEASAPRNGGPSARPLW